MIKPGTPCWIVNTASLNGRVVQVVNVVDSFTRFVHYMHGEWYVVEASWLSEILGRPGPYAAHREILKPMHDDPDQSTEPVTRDLELTS